MILEKDFILDNSYVYGYKKENSEGVFTDFFFSYSVSHIFFFSLNFTDGKNVQKLRNIILAKLLAPTPNQLTSHTHRRGNSLEHYIQ